MSTTRNFSKADQKHEYSELDIKRECAFAEWLWSIAKNGRVALDLDFFKKAKKRFAMNQKQIEDIIEKFDDTVDGFAIDHADGMVFMVVNCDDL